MEDKNTFEYTYTAEEHDEIARIREKYIGASASGEGGELQKLVALDRAVTRRASVPAIVLGIVGTLILGLGMSTVMTTFADGFALRLGIDKNALGIAVGIVGMILAALAYPTYTATLSRERKRVAPKIMELSDRLMK